MGLSAKSRFADGSSEYDAPQAMIRAVRIHALVAVIFLAACASTPPVADRSWYWLGTLQSLDAIDAPSPERYTLRIAADRAAIRADCNRGAGSVSLERDRVAFGPMALTRAFCPPPSRGDEYARQLQGASRLEVHGDVMRMALKDGGTMFFAADPKALVAHYRCRDGKMMSVVYAGEAAQLWFDGAHYALARERSASGARYGDGAVTFDTKGAFGSLSRGEAFPAQNCQVPGR